MRTARGFRRTILSTACSAALLWSVPGFAQSHTVRFRDAPNTVGAEADFTTAEVVQVYEAVEPFTAPGLLVPANLTVSDSFLPLVESMLRTSPMFRRQCLRIAGATGLTVVIRSRPSHPQGARARTQLTMGPAGRRHAVVEVMAMQDHAELIAHELEHIIEQLDGIDLATRVTIPDTGVRRCADGAFETTRATRTGLAVAEEMRRSGK
jgi:hypothetical protein